MNSETSVHQLISPILLYVAQNVCKNVMDARRGGVMLLYSVVEMRKCHARTDVVASWGANVLCGGGVP